MTTSGLPIETNKYPPYTNTHYNTHVDQTTQVPQISQHLHPIFQKSMMERASRGQTNAANGSNSSKTQGPLQSASVNNFTYPTTNDSNYNRPSGKMTVTTKTLDDYGVIDEANALNTININRTNGILNININNSTDYSRMDAE